MKNKPTLKHTYLSPKAKYSIELDCTGEYYTPSGRLDVDRLTKEIAKEAKKFDLTVKELGDGPAHCPMYEFTGTLPNLRQYMWVYSGSRSDGDEAFLDLIAFVEEE